MSSTTLRQINNFPSAPASLANAALILIDYQNTYTEGVMELDGWAPALQEAQELLAKARALGSPVIHVINDGGPGTPYDVRERIGQIHDALAPIKGEKIVTKKAPDAFVGTDLGTVLAVTGRTEIVIAGFMTHMCVSGVE